LFASSSGIAYAIAGWIVLREVIVKARFMSKDRRYFKIATQSTSLTRETIATDFAGFRSNWYRVKYVEWLRDAQVQPQGMWPDRPNHNDDSASTLLAQLHERWLGLEV
jgi:hypothetical protein